VSGVLLILFALIPGFPTLTFLTLAIAFGSLGFYLLRKEKSEANRETDIPTMLTSGAGAPAVKPAKGKARQGQKLSEKEEFALTVPLLIELDAGLQEMMEAAELNDELARVRRALYLDLGVPFPGIHLRFNEGMALGEYVIQLQEIPVARGQLKPRNLLVTDNHEQLDLLGIGYETVEPFLPGIDTLWVDEKQRAALDKGAVSYFDFTRILTYHLSHVLKEYAEDFIGIQESRYLLEQMEGSYAELVKEAQRIIPLQKITEILQRLVSEDISIRNMRAILESMVEWGQKEKDVVQLTEYIRSSLRRYICYKYSNGQNVLPAYLLDQQVEDTIRNGVRQTAAGSYLALDPSVTQQFLVQVKNTVGDPSRMPHKPVMVVSMDIRRYVRKLIESDLYELPVLSFQELTQQINVQPLGRINM